MSRRKLDGFLLENRRAEIRDAALSIINEQGIENLTMDKVVKILPYSKGTVYKSYGCMEELVMALSNENMRALVACINQARAMSSDPEQQLLSVNVCYCLFHKKFPLSVQLFMCAKIPVFSKKSSCFVCEEHIKRENELVEILREIVEQCYLTGKPFNANFNSRNIAIQNYLMLSGHALIAGHNGADSHEKLVDSMHRYLQLFLNGISLAFDKEQFDVKVMQLAEMLKNCPPKIDLLSPKKNRSGVN